VIDLDRYPIHELDAAGGAALVADCRRQVRSAKRGIACDLLPADAPARRLYESEHLTASVAAAFGAGVLYRSADPLDALPITFFEPGDELGVTPVAGAHPRINSVLTYGTSPGMRLTDLTSRLFYGRISPRPT
jgi:hypothetical protein